MATQAYYPRENSRDKKIDTTPLAQKLAPGHPPELQPRDGAENRTPSPTRAPTTTELEITRSKSWGRSDGGPGDNPGKSGYGGPSSLNPGERSGPATIDPHGPAGADPVLRNLAMGTQRAVDQNDDWQTRKLDEPGDNNLKPAPVHDHFAKRAADSGSPGGMIPSTLAPKDALGKDAFQPRRDAALKRTQ